MGEVYRARDTRLGRDVALKVLPQALAADPERRARLEREARLLAALNHPNIATLLGIEESPAECALVMELVDGETLADRLALRASGQTALPVKEVLTIARQIADALESAHERGIVHRDLKPANIKVRPDGTVNVLDFGLSTGLTSASTGSLAATAVLTEPPGVSGTAALHESRTGTRRGVQPPDRHLVVRRRVVRAAHGHLTVRAPDHGRDAGQRAG
jgi:serine/threonine protein kinase